MRDRGLVRQILRAIAKTGDPYLEGVGRNAHYYYNLCLVVDDGLVSGITYMRAVDNGELSWSMASPRLTNAGHDFLEG